MAGPPRGEQMTASAAAARRADNHLRVASRWLPPRGVPMAASARRARLPPRGEPMAATLSSTATLSSAVTIICTVTVESYPPQAGQEMAKLYVRVRV